MGNFTGGGGGGLGSSPGGGGSAGGFSRGGGTGGFRAAPLDERSVATLRWVVSGGELDALARRLAKAAKAGCKAAKPHLAARGKVDAKGELRPHAEGALVLVRVELRAERLDGTPTGTAFAAFAAAFESDLAAAGYAARRLRA